MRTRKIWLEPLFAEAKDRPGRRRFRWRGLEKVNLQAHVIAPGSPSHRRDRSRVPVPRADPAPHPDPSDLFQKAKRSYEQPRAEIGRSCSLDNGAPSDERSSGDGGLHVPLVSKCAKPERSTRCFPASNFLIPFWASGDVIPAGRGAAPIEPDGFGQGMRGIRLGGLAPPESERSIRRAAGCAAAQRLVLVARGRSIPSLNSFPAAGDKATLPRARAESRRVSRRPARRIRRPVVRPRGDPNSRPAGSTPLP